MVETPLMRDQVHRGLKSGHLGTWRVADPEEVGGLYITPFAELMIRVSGE